jgi:MOSC domain-containing protein YiiM
VARLESINVSNGGVPKAAVRQAHVTRNGVSGDRQRDRRFHGGPDRAVTLFSLERIALLQAEGHPIQVGTTGENLTVSGLDWEALAPGARLRVGAALLQVTSYTTPCANLVDSFVAGDFKRIAQRDHPGWSRLCARVLEEGGVAVGDAVEVLANPRSVAG